MKKEVNSYPYLYYFHTPKHLKLVLNLFFEKYKRNQIKLLLNSLYKWYFNAFSPKKKTENKNIIGNINNI